VNNWMSYPSNLTPNGHRRKDHIRDDNANED